MNVCGKILLEGFTWLYVLITEFKAWAMKLRPAALSPAKSITCDRSHRSYDLCLINGSALFDPKTSTFFSVGHTDSTPSQPSLRIKTQPYPRKSDKSAMSKVKELTITTSAPPNLSCGVTHTSPALVFSAGGYNGNFFHEFMDCFVPLFITINSHFPDQDVILAIADCNDQWARKYAELLPRFTRHPIININNQAITHCFPSVTLGLISHGRMVINPTLLPKPKTLVDFQSFLANAYNENTNTSSSFHHTKPKLVLVSRNVRVGRTILNLREVKKAAEELGFDVTIFEPEESTSLADSFRFIHACHAMVGVHGAALTHSLFLRPGSVLMQVVPIGTQWLSKVYFEKPARVLGLEYLEYKIKQEESSLVEKYGANDLVLKNPQAFAGANWSNMRVYLKTQNVKLDIDRFRIYLKDAYKKAKKLMDKEIKLAY